MSTAALLRPRPPLTVADFVALPEDVDQRWEMLDGNLVMSSSSTPRHNLAGFRFASVLVAA